MLRFYDRLLQASGVLVAIVLFVIAMLMCLDIGVRAFNLGALPWVIEVAEYLMYACTFIGAPWALRQGAHVRVDIFVSGLPPRGARFVDRVVDIIGLTISLILLVYGVLAVIDAWRGDMRAFKTWTYPEWVLLLAVPISCALLCVEFVLRFLGLRSPERSAGTTHPSAAV
jgi:TRAP-type C4-dicarboxylate transport system permease small subunit